ncbi:hypothetical protein [Cryptosporidium parvum Iowa II]|uniref:Signal peptide containing protein n=2 Tax=Cryptosporidium parvum TaxID=5807 RepID=Q5CUR5_CRYPI|nr:hypothetical protein [Cryptosporidium parvum Iowa II]EAK89117.1 conserved hypothetical protein [Cryptosporidium parvum Iowa II]QOY42526.1 Uncharacterized protein CPATCC_0032730 [Cryptosporidium parvum]WKS76919.1 hypothetical protein CPCDC_3g1770 [Cryptosporidium sp. 43IA8]WRK31411.1 Uncharacterized protein cpbgf_3001770 [Cryptosporidium parvum]|eukprot:QOY42526.1 hypothetical protein CPATCC_001173 [Cryptosporidium parvum]
MKLKLLSLIHLFLFFVLFSEFKYGEINHYQKTPFNSFVKLKISSNLNGKPKDSEQPKSPQRTIRGPSYTLRDTSSSQKPPSGAHQTVGSTRRVFSWPPTETPGKKTTKPASPKSLSRGYSWPPGGRTNPIIGQDGASSVGSQHLDTEDLFTAIKVQVTDEDSDEEAEPVTAKLVMLSDSDTDSDSSEPGTPTSKSSSSGSESDTSVPGTPVTKRATIIKSEQELSPELAEKVQRMREVSERIVKKKLSTGDVQSLIKSSKLTKRLLLIPIPLLIQLLQAIFMFLTARNTTMLSPLMLSQIKFQSQSSASPKSGLFLTNLEIANRSISSLKQDLKEEFQKKYGVECNFSFLKAQIQTFLKLYLEQAKLEEEFRIISNPRKGRVENRAQKIELFYKELKPRLQKIKREVIVFLDCYLTYLDTISSKNIEPTKREDCSWSDLMVLNFFLTAFKGLAMLFRESLTPFESDIEKFERLKERPKKDLSESERQILKTLNPSMRKVEQLRSDSALSSLVSSVLLTIMGKCINHLNSEN